MCACVCGGTVLHYAVGLPPTRRDRPRHHWLRGHCRGLDRDLGRRCDGARGEPRVEQGHVLR